MLGYIFKRLLLLKKLIQLHNVARSIYTWFGKNTSGAIDAYPTIHYSAMLRYVPWAIWSGKSRNHEYFMRQFHWFLKESTAEN